MIGIEQDQPSKQSQGSNVNCWCPVISKAYYDNVGMCNLCQCLNEQTGYPTVVQLPPIYKLSLAMSFDT